MGSKREEERNEKIIRGLMKLPPNRRCINCNSLGPQYVCTNFWSFVCVTCSGIHREFTHRVKSVSMAKFTSQEVEALQNGGNQRARDIYLKDWDLQRQRLPEGSNVDKIRQFIKDVYVDKKYAGGKTSEKPPRDTQNRGIHEDETRRASSYHSYSQSPPYDYQYEDRRYGKAASLTRKPGSDRGRYEGKLSSFMYSPGRVNEQMYDDKFSNEGSISRVSNYSASSGGEPFRSGPQSPNFQKDDGFTSPSFQLSREGSREDIRHHSRGSFPQRSRSSGSFGSFDGNFLSQASVNSCSEQNAGTQDRLPFPGASVPGSSDSLDFFDAQAVPEKSSSAAPIDLFQLPEAPPPVSVDLFQAPTVSSVVPTDSFQPTQSSLTSLDLFVVTDEPVPTSTSNEKLSEFPAIKNEGWATFDSPQFFAPSTTEKKLTPAIIPSDSGGESSSKLDLFSLETSAQWASSQDSSLSGHPNISSLWDGNLQGVQAPNSTNAQLWNAFEDSSGYLASGGINHDTGLPLVTDGTSTANQDVGLTSLGSAGFDGFQWVDSHVAPPSGPVLSSVGYIHPVLPVLGESVPPPMDRKSSNPFDLPFDSELEESNMFLDMDMTSLQAALPNPQLSSDFLADVSQPWFPQNSASPYIPSAGQGGVTYLAPQVPSSQIQNVSTQGPVASIGGNPFS